jgi:hypothetical protein
LRLGFQREAHVVAKTRAVRQRLLDSPVEYAIELEHLTVSAAIMPRIASPAAGSSGAFSYVMLHSC